MTMLGRKRDAADKAKKAEKARQRAEEAARKAREAAEAAERAAREAAEAEADAEQQDEPEDEPQSKAESKAAAPDKTEEPDAEDAPKADKADEADEDVEAIESDDDGDEPKPVLTKSATKAKDAERDDADEAEDEAVDEADDEAEDAERGPGRVRRVLGAVASAGAPGYTLIAVNVALVVGLVWLVLAVNRANDQEAAADQVKFAASRAAEDLSSYDFRTIDADLKRASGQTTGRFRTEFERLIERTRTSATQQQAVVEGTALKTAVESVDGDRAIALVFLNQQTVKASNAQRTPSQFSMRLVMRKVGERWLVSELQML